MKKIAIVVCILAGIKVAGAQDKDNKLSKITAPTSPAAYMIGAQPSAVLSPKSYQALETALFSNFNNTDGKTILPNDLALEFTPYWATDHGLTLDEVLYPKGLWTQIVRNASFSAATSQNFLLENKDKSSALSLGFRTSIFIGGEADKTKITAHTNTLKARQQLRNTLFTPLQELSAKDTTIKNAKQFLEKGFPIMVISLKKHYGNIPEQELILFKERLDKGIGQLPAYNAPPSDNSAFEGELIDLLTIEANAIKAIRNADIDNIVETFESYIKKRKGLSVDFAYGTFLNFPTNKFDYSMAPRQSFWISPSYSLIKNEGMDIDMVATGVLRYEWYNLDYYTTYFPSSKNFSNNFDYGLSLAGEFKKFTVQLEAVGRAKRSLIPAGTDSSGDPLYKKVSDSDFQCVGSLSYRINDEVALTYSLGDSFNSFLNQGKTLISLLSLNLGFGGPTKKDLKTAN